MNGTSGNRASPGEYGSVLIPFKQGTVPARFFEGTDDRFSEEEIPSSQPFAPDSQPASAPASLPASMPTSFPASQPASPESKRGEPASIPSSVPAPADTLPGGVEESAD
jgi:hypothetical protein